MGICIGGNWCRTQECKNRCKGWFGAQPEIERSCKNACKVNSGLEKENFLCSGDWLDQRVVISAYGYDPCPGDSISTVGFLDPLGEHETANQKSQNNNKIILLLIGLIVLSLIGLLAIKFFK